MLEPATEHASSFRTPAITPSFGLLPVVAPPPDPNARKRCRSRSALYVFPESKSAFSAINVYPHSAPTIRCQKVIVTRGPPSVVDKIRLLLPGISGHVCESDERYGIASLAVVTVAVPASILIVNISPVATE